MLDIWKLVQGSDFQATELSKFVEVQIQVIALYQYHICLCMFLQQYFLFIRHNLVTFNQVTWTHILVVGQHLVKTLVIYPLFSTFGPRDTFMLTITLKVLSTFLENVAIPTYWFYSSYINFNELWSSVNVFYRIKRNKKAFYISGNLRPRIGRNIMKMTLRKTQSNPSKETRITIGNIFGNMSQQVDVDI